MSDNPPPLKPLLARVTPESVPSVRRSPVSPKAREVAEAIVNAVQAEGEVAKVRHELQEERRSAALAERDLRQQLEAERTAHSAQRRPFPSNSDISREYE